MIEEVDENIWGEGYRIVLKKVALISPIQLTDDDQMCIARKLFPEHDRLIWSPPAMVGNQAPRFTQEELAQAVAKLKEKKAAGPDGLPPEIVKLFATNFSELCLNMMNNLLIAGYFPETWKEARLVLIEKEKKPGQDIAEHRPLCLISALGKLLEHLLLIRLTEDIENDGGLAEHPAWIPEGSVYNRCPS